ncbi:serine O-acetyltransferase [Winogradskyella sp. UBA3174]|uniref:serine O-acetyltransferase n=1 Tax=Winogradskyella sp. UBA3174 TaxID=1947785 RepID=UPI0025DE924B|nr:serine acetyltransferase [Winogradskyella sp. UBA3174]|tara:strand:- start:50682 stop:51263 length:582 start_codon:yes stop_codon:yes gene_type:complete
MISSKEDYIKYLNQDKKALGVKSKSLEDKLVRYISPNPIWTFQKRMRKLEFYNNCKNKGIFKLYVFYLKYRFKKISIKLGFSIPINVFGPGLSIVHYGTIVINSRTKVGSNCRMHACVNIGASGGKKEAPQIGDNVYIAPGAKIYGDITIANNIAIGANAVVNKSFNEEHIVLGGIPAKPIGEVNIKKIIKHI